MKDRIDLDLGFDSEPVLEHLQVIPEDERHIRLVSYLRDIACEMAFKRHAGVIKHLYGPQEE